MDSSPFQPDGSLNSMSDQPENNLSTELVDFEFPNTVMGRFRQFVHGIAGKWALRTLRQQQNNINLTNTEMWNFIG